MGLQAIGGDGELEGSILGETCNENSMNAGLVSGYDISVWQCRSIGRIA